MRRQSSNASLPAPIEDDVSELQRARLAATITLPSCVAGPFAVRKRAVVAPPSGANADPEAAKIPGLFPLTFNLPAVDLVAGDADDGGEQHSGDLGGGARARA